MANERSWLLANDSRRTKHDTKHEENGAGTASWLLGMRFCIMKVFEHDGYTSKPDVPERNTLCMRAFGDFHFDRPGAVAFLV